MLRQESIPGDHVIAKGEGPLSKLVSSLIFPWGGGRWEECRGQRRSHFYFLLNDVRQEICVPQVKVFFLDSGPHSGLLPVINPYCTHSQRTREGAIENFRSEYGKLFL